MSNAPKKQQTYCSYTAAVRSFVHDVWSPVDSIGLISMYPSPLITRFCTALIGRGGGVEHNTIIQCCPENTSINYGSHTWYHRYCINAGITQEVGLKKQLCVKTATTLSVTSRCCNKSLKHGCIDYIIYMWNFPDQQRKKSIPPRPCCCCSHTNSHNQVRGHRTGSSHSGAPGKTHTTQGGTRIYHRWRISCLHQKHIKVKSGVSLRCARSRPEVYASMMRYSSDISPSEQPNDMRIDDRRQSKLAHFNVLVRVLPWCPGIYVYLYKCCEDEFRQNLRSHRWRVYCYFYNISSPNPIKPSQPTYDRDGSFRLVHSVP